MSSLPTLSLKCPNCGGPVTFDPAKQRFDCDYCLSEFDEAALVAAAARQEQTLAPEPPPAQAGAGADDAEAEVLYHCPSCGAEVATSPTTAAAICYFCHNPVVLSGRLAREFRPQLVLPFAIDRDQAVQRFLAWARSKKFVPKDFFRPEQIETMNGVYYPYWLADYQGRAHFSGQGTTVSTNNTGSHQVTTTDYYVVRRDLELDFRDLARPALAQADRQLVGGVHPFDMAEARPFSPAYLSGFLAEKRDVEAAAVQPGVEAELNAYVEREIRAPGAYASLEGQTETAYTKKTYKYCLLPTWVLTYKGRDGKDYHYAMNGQNGAACGVLPIDKPRLWASTALWFGVVAGLLMLGGWLLI